MFTGIVEELGSLHHIEKFSQGSRLSIQASKVLEDVKIGDSLSVNGCCLTVVDFQSSYWLCDVVEETLNKTHFHDFSIGDPVNLERAMRYQDRIGGHLVQGHIDETGSILDKILLSDNSWWVSIQASPQILRYVILKGCIAVDGVSLTVAEVGPSHFAFAMIPHTAQMTTLGIKEKGRKVNLEVDFMAKYIERFTSPFNKTL